MIASLGKYELIEELNSGSMGTVYVARDRVLDRKVALKTVLPGAHLDDELRERFYREARACARLQHPAIVTIYDFGEENGTAYIAMELLTGTDVRRLIAERRPLPLDVKLDLGAMVCEGLEHAHAQGIVHRDIKPSNIFVTEDGRAKILDFGIARTATSSLTMVGRVLGTPNYMAPEQILGKPCDARSDLFSVAIVLYELITGTHPFKGESIPRRIVREAPDDLRSILPQAPAELAAILAKALEKKPDQRYQSGKGLAIDLRASALSYRDSSGGTSTRARVASPEMFAAPAVPAPAPAPMAGEGTEVMMSRVLTALQEFDDAVERSDVAAARRAFEAVRMSAVGDERFEGAVKSSQERLYDLERSAPPAPEAVADTGERTQEIAAPVAGESLFGATKLFESPALSQSSERAAAVPVPPSAAPAAAPAPPSVKQAEPPAREPVRGEYGGGDATRFFEMTSVPQPGTPKPPAPYVPSPPPPPPPPPPASRAGEKSPTGRKWEPFPRPRAADEAPAAPAPAVRKAEPSPPPPASNAAPVVAARPAPAVTPLATDAPVAAAAGPASPVKTILIVGAAVVALILAAGGYFLFAHRGSNALPLPSVATAVVTASRADVVAQPDRGGEAVVRVPKGETLQILRVPRSALQEWVTVQYVTSKTVYPSGYARTADLGNWNSSKPDAALVLLRAFEPPPGASDVAIEDQLAKLTAFTQRFAGTRQETEARLDMARWNVELARSAGSAGKPDGAFVQAANDNLNQAATLPDLSAQVAQIRQDLASLGGAKGKANAAASQPQIPPEAAMRRAQTAYDNGDYSRAEFYVRQVLIQQKGNEAALALLSKIKSARDFERKLGAK